MVCRARDDADRSGWEQEAFEKRYAESRPGAVNPGVDGSGLQLPTEGSVFTVTVTAKFGDPPPGPLIIDLEALPEAQPGSDADRAGRGLLPE